MKAIYNLNYFKNKEEGEKYIESIKINENLNTIQLKANFLYNFIESTYYTNVHDRKILQFFIENTFLLDKVTFIKEADKKKLNAYISYDVENIKAGKITAMNFFIENINTDELTVIECINKMLEIYEHIYICLNLKEN